MMPSAPTAAAILASADNPTQVSPGQDAAADADSYIYQSFNDMARADTTVRTEKGTAWVLHSAGPDSVFYNLGGVLANDRPEDIEDTIGLIYDPTNGTISFGSIWRSGGSPQASGSYAGGTGLIDAINRQN